MLHEGSRVLMVGASSDIGAHLASQMLARGIQVCGTYRGPSDSVAELIRAGAKLDRVDLADHVSVNRWVAKSDLDGWDGLLLNPATMNPIGLFHECDWEEWHASVQVNALSQLHLVHSLLPRRSTTGHPLVLLWGGPATNSAAPGYSAIAASKLLLIKMMELLSAEYPEVRFVSVGPGWVDTKIHIETLEADSRAGGNLERTKARLASGQVTSLDKVWRFIEWVFAQPAELVSGRNFSVNGDLWGTEDLQGLLASDPDALKMRRYRNDWRPSERSTRFIPPTYD